MDIRPATLVRAVASDERWLDVVNEAKGLTWTHKAEHALIRANPGGLLLVRGGMDGIAFDVSDDGVFLFVDGKSYQVTFLAWHTHPRATGPSDHDRRFIRMLGQPSSMIYEMFTDGSGTRFFAK